jgi:hypothetical protein
MQVRSLLMVASAAILVSSAAFGQGSASDTVFQIHHFTNVNVLDGFINVTNSGAAIGMNFAVNSGSGPFSSTPVSFFGGTANNYSIVGYGDICVNAYVFSPDEQLQSCCSCHLSPNALGSWDVAADLTANTLTGVHPKDVIVKLVATLWNGSVAQIVPSTGVTTFASVLSGTCNAALAGVPVSLFNVGINFPTNAALIPNSVLTPGMIAWGRNQGSETGFEPATLSMGAGTVYVGEPTPQKELDRLTALCAFSTQNGSGTGVCKTCRVGGL